MLNIEFGLFLSFMILLHGEVLHARFTRQFPGMADTMR